MPEDERYPAIWTRNAHKERSIIKEKAPSWPMRPPLTHAGEPDGGGGQSGHVGEVLGSSDVNSQRRHR